MIEKSCRLGLKPGVVQTEKSGDWVRPRQALVIGCKKRYLTTQDVDRQNCGFVRSRGAFQGRIDVLDEREIGAPVGTVQCKVEARRAAQVKLRIVVARSDHATDRDIAAAKA